MSGVGYSGVSIVTGVSDGTGVSGSGSVWTPGGGSPTVYATWNSADKAGTITLSNGDLTATTTTASWQLVRGTVGKTSGKYYYEINWPAHSGGAGTGELIFGVARDTHPLSGSYTGQGGAFGWGYQNKSPTSLKFSPSAFPTYVPYANTVGIRFGCYIDLDAGEISYAFGGVDKGVANSGQTFGTVYPALWLYYTATTAPLPTVYFNPADWLYPSTYPSASAWTA